MPRSLSQVSGQTWWSWPTLCTLDGHYCFAMSCNVSCGFVMFLLFVLLFLLYECCLHLRIVKLMIVSHFLVCLHMEPLDQEMIHLKGLLQIKNLLIQSISVATPLAPVVQLPD